MYIDNKKREEKPLGRFEIIAERYIHGTDKEREIILSFFNEDEKKTFLEGIGLFRLFTDSDYYKQVQSEVGQQIWNEVNGIA